MTSYVENETEVQFTFNIEQLVLELMNTTLNEENCPYEAQVNLLITDNPGIQELNLQFRGIDRETDVLSFPAIPFEKEADFSIVEQDESAYFDPDSGELILGDIMISADKVKEQAENYGHSIKREFSFLVTHSLLHLCGYDHMKEEEAARMEAKQEKILSILGITRE